MGAVIRTSDGRAVSLGNATLKIGRSRDNDIILNNNQVSSHLAEIRPGGDGHYLIVDLNSSNGTTINGIKLTPGEPRPINTDNKISLGGAGGVELRFELTDDAPNWGQPQFPAPPQAAPGGFGGQGPGVPGGPPFGAGVGQPPPGGPGFAPPEPAFGGNFPPAPAPFAPAPPQGGFGAPEPPAPFPPPQPGGPPPGQFVPGGPPPGQYAPGGPPQGAFAPGGPPPGQFAPGGPPQAPFQPEPFGGQFGGQPPPGQFAPPAPGGAPAGPPPFGGPPVGQPFGGSPGFAPAPQGPGPFGAPPPGAFPQPGFPGGPGAFPPPGGPAAPRQRHTLRTILLIVGSLIVIILIVFALLFALGKLPKVGGGSGTATPKPGPTVTPKTTIMNFYDDLKKQDYTAATNLFTQDFLTMHGGADGTANVLRGFDNIRGKVVNYSIVATNGSATSQTATVQVTRDKGGTFGPDQLQLAFQQANQLWKLSNWMPGPGQ